MNDRNVQWLHMTPLTALQNMIVAVGAMSSGQTVMLCPLFPFFRFSLYADQACTFEVEGSTVSNEAAGPWRTLVSHSYPGSVLHTPYDLTGGLANNNGWITVGHPYIRVRLIDTSGIAHTVTELFCQAWG